MEKNPERQGPKQSSEQSRRNKGTAKRRSDVLEVLERHKQFNDKMEQMHTDKMARLDRLLNLDEREIEAKESCNK